jgi:D-aspartate ligase
MEFRSGLWPITRLTYRRAAELAIDFPASFRAGGLDEIERLDCRFPVILKPAFRKSMDEFTQAKAWKADDRDQLRALYKRAAALVGGEAIIVQEWIPGTGESQYSYAGLWQRGEPVASLVAARRRRQHPIDFGRSSTSATSPSGRPESRARRARRRRLSLSRLAAGAWRHCADGTRANGAGLDAL